MSGRSIKKRLYDEPPYTITLDVDLRDGYCSMYAEEMLDNDFARVFAQEGRWGVDPKWIMKRFKRVRQAISIDRAAIKQRERAVEDAASMIADEQSFAIDVERAMKELDGICPI